MRKFLIGVALFSVVMVACAPEDETTSASATDTGSATSTGTADPCAPESLTLVNEGVLTVGTGNPAYPPWWEGGETDEHSEWQINDPHLLEGFEGAVVGAVAEQLGFTTDQIEFIPVPFGKSYAPGPKDFDFVVQQISFKDKRAEAVDFSESYYDVNQALVSVEGSSIEGATTFEDLKDAKLGAALGTTSYDYIVENIQPDVEPAVYNDVNGVVQALKNGQIDGMVTDLPGAFYLTAVEVPKGIIVGQFPTVGAQEYFGLVFEKGESLVTCVNAALQELKADGTLAAIQQEWLADKTSAPVIEG